MSHYTRSFENILKSRLKETPRFVQCILGPRQVGKTSGVLNVLKSHFKPDNYLYLTAEEQVVDSEWFFHSLQQAKQKKAKILVLDEIQKLDNWSELVKQAWDQQKREQKLIHWVLLGSSSLQLTQGLGESLAGRFETIPVTHWSYSESAAAFKLKLSDYITHGGYPGSYALIKNPQRFKSYMLESIFESVVTKDILRYATVKKPALFRQTFIQASQYPAQEISYNKLLGQLQEAGNVDQIKHYLDLFSQAFLMRLIFKWSQTPMSRTSSPKLISRAPVLTALFHKGPLSNELKGRIFEGLVGNRLCECIHDVYYWRHGHNEVDFVVEVDNKIIGIEVKSENRRSVSLSAFKKVVKNSRVCTIDFNNFIEFDRNPVEFVLDNSI